MSLLIREYNIVALVLPGSEDKPSLLTRIDVIKPDHFYCGLIKFNNLGYPISPRMNHYLRDATDDEKNRFIADDLLQEIKDDIVAILTDPNKSKKLCYGQLCKILDSIRETIDLDVEYDANWTM